MFTRMDHRKNVREFTSNGKYFGFINSQGKFVIYDVELSSVHQVYTPNLHLSTPITCFTWISVSQNEKGGKNKNKKQRTTEQQSYYAAFGTSKGGIALYSVSSSKIETYFKGEGHSGSVTCIVRNGSNQLLTAGSDGNVLEWNISACKQNKVYNVGVDKLSCLTALGESKFLTGSKQLKLWEHESITTTLTGHTSDTTILQNIKIGNLQYAISASALDRPVSLWSLEEDKKSPVVSFQVDDTTEYIHTKLIKDKLIVVIVSKSGIVNYFVQNLDKLENRKPIKAKYTFEIASDSVAGKSVERVPIFVATLDNVSKDLELLIGYGTENNVKFEKIELDGEVKNNLIIREAPKLFTHKDDIQSEQSFKKKTAFIEEAEYLDSVLASKKVLKTVEIPMESRLENLSLTSGGIQKPNAKNMAQLLIQGLHSKDSSILKLVFGKSDEESIKITLQKLPPQYVSSLLNEISLLMQQKTERVATAVIWLKFLVQIHASQLMALGTQNFLSNMGVCLGVIEHRVQHLGSLSRLSGRLNLLINQIERNKNSDEINDKNLLVYQEEDSDEVDSLLDKEENSVDEHWEESADEENDAEMVENNIQNSDGSEEEDDSNEDEEEQDEMEVSENESNDDDSD